MKTALLATVLLAAASTASFAQVKVSDPWIRATVPQQKATGAFMSITAPKGARLVEARSPVAGVVEVHEMKLENNMMRMRAVPSLELPAGKAVELKPGGYHIMLMELRQQMKEGDSVPIMLVLEGPDKKRDTVEVKAVVRALTAEPIKSHTH